MQLASPKYQEQCIKWGGQQLVLHPLKAAFLPIYKTLICSDLHIGKAAHFRKNGIALPQSVNTRNTENLQLLLEYYQPERIVFLGDLVHSVHNNEWDEFTEFIEKIGSVNMILVKGNHDVLPDNMFLKASITVESNLMIDQLLLVHEPEPVIPNGIFALSGHIHPSVLISGRARQNLRLPCFHFGSQQALLPAFGEFTGNATIRPIEGDQVFVIAEKRVMEISKIWSPE